MDKEASWAAVGRPPAPWMERRRQSRVSAASRTSRMTHVHGTWVIGPNRDGSIELAEARWAGSCQAVKL